MNELYHFIKILKRKVFLKKVNLFYLSIRKEKQYQYSEIFSQIKISFLFTFKNNVYRLCKILKIFITWSDSF